MPKKPIRQTSQSVIGLFHALGVDATSLPRTRPLYRRLVTLLEGAIARGDVPAGMRLPPERDLAAALDISRATVVSATGSSGVAWCAGLRRAQHLRRQAGCGERPVRLA